MTKSNIKEQETKSSLQLTAYSLQPAAVGGRRSAAGVLSRFGIALETPGGPSPCTLSVFFHGLPESPRPMPVDSAVLFLMSKPDGHEQQRTTSRDVLDFCSLLSAPCAGGHR
jgi:hypothetical protein